MVEIQAGKINLPYGRLKKPSQLTGPLTAAGIGPPYGPHTAAAACRADTDVDVPDGPQEFRHREPRVSLAEPLAALKSKDKPQFF